jgi:hypothetical protein
MVTAITQSDRSVLSIGFWKKTPSKMIGTEPMMMNQPILASGSFRGMRPNSALTHLLMMRQMSAAK